MKCSFDEAMTVQKRNKEYVGAMGIRGKGDTPDTWNGTQIFPYSHTGDGITMEVYMHNNGKEGRANVNRADKNPTEHQTEYHRAKARTAEWEDGTLITRH